MSTSPDARSDRRGSPSVFGPIVICFVAVVLVIALVIWNYERQQHSNEGGAEQSEAVEGGAGE